jgi:hypothetical protein
MMLQRPFVDHGKLTGLLMVGLTAAITALAATGYQITTYVISASAGTTQSTGYQLRGIVGQSIITPVGAFSSTHRLRSGQIPIFHSGSGSTSTDTDNDTIPDSYEMAHGLNPANNDTALDLDNDGVTNLQEYELGTNPGLADTDGDGYTDKEEVDAGTSPTDGDDMPRRSKAWKAIIPLILNK